MIHNTDKGGDSTKTLMSVILSDSQDGQSTPVRIMTYSGPDDYAHLKEAMPKIIPGIDDLEALSCVCFTLTTGKNVISFVPKASLPAEAAIPSIAEPAIVAPVRSFYQSCEFCENSPHVLAGPFSPVSFCSANDQLAGLRWGDYESPLSSPIGTLEDIASVAYYDLLTMYGGDLKLIFDLNGQCNGSNWHCPYGDWQRDQPLTDACIPLTPAILAEWARIGNKCCNINTPSLHNHSRDRLVPCMLHFSLGLVPYNVQGIEKFGELIVTAGCDALQQSRIENLASLGQQLVDVLLEQEETSRAFFVVATPFERTKGLLEEQEALRAAAPMLEKSNFDQTISVLKNRLRRSEKEVAELRTKQSGETTMVVDLKKQIDELRRAMGPEAAAKCDWLRALMKKAMAAVGSVPQVYFGGRALVGNDCKKILGDGKTFLGILEEGYNDKVKEMFPTAAQGPWLKSIKEKFSLWRPLFGTLDCFFSLANSSRRLTDAQLSEMDQCTPIIKGLWLRLYGNLPSSPPKVHILVDHVMAFAWKYRFFVHGGEQIGEKEHAKDNRHSRQLSSLKKQYARIEKGKENLRIQQSDPGQQAAARLARENTARIKPAGKKTKKEVNAEAKDLVKSEVRNSALAAGRAVLAPPPAPPL